MMNKIALQLKSFSRNQKLLVLVTADLFIAFSCWVVFGPPLSFLIASNFEISLWDIISTNYISFLVPFSGTLIFFAYFGFYRSMMKFFNSKDSIITALVGSFIFGFLWGAVYLSQYELIRRDYLVTTILQAFLLSSVFYAFIQISRDIAGLFLYPHKERFDGKPILIYGAGSAGIELYQALKGNPDIRIIGFFDNSQMLKGAEINNLTVYGKKKQIKKLSQDYPNMEIYLAIPKLNINERRRIISSLEKFRVAVRSMPALHEVIADEKKMAEMQDLSIDDILPGARITAASVKNAATSSFLISGAGGSIGSEITRQILLNNPKIIILFEMSEFNLFKIERECSVIKSSENLSTQVIPILGDIRDTENLKHIFCKYSIDTVYHAAAYKHVPLVEDEHNIAKAAENNILGTFNLAQAAIQNNVSSFVMISTDKAVRPTNVMGATKRFSEIIIQSLNDVNPDIKFSMVRFGNVINSSGSVIPLFMDQIALGGPVTITDKDVMRYFMTIPEASNLVLQAGELSSGGEVFILDMGEQIKIYDLAKKLIHLSGRNYANTDTQEGIKIVEIGLRPGEKMYEELLISGLEIKTENEKIFKANETDKKRCSMLRWN